MNEKHRIFLYVTIGVIIMIYLGRKLVPAYIEKMALAIMNFEGWFEDSRSVRNNNPGNLRWFQGKPFPWSGAIGVDESYHVIFDSFESGWNALIKQLRLAFNNKSGVYSTSDTLYEFFKKYAEANTLNYANYVANQLGVKPDTTLEQIKLTVV